MENKKVFITGITSMDASHLADYLLENQDVEIYGFIRRTSTDNTWRIRHILDKIELITGDMCDTSSINKAIQLVKPDFVFNTAAQSFVKASWDSPEFTFDVNAIGVIRLLEAIKCFGKKDTRIFQCSSSEMFGKVQETPQIETTKFYPRSPYGVSKCAAHWLAVNFRESYNMFISCGISFNHESFRRGLEFVSRKISYNVAKIHLGLADCIELGNLDTKRDFGYAPEFCEAFWKILQLDQPDDFVLATGENHSIREFVQEAFRVVGILNWQDYVKQNPNLMRPAEVDYLLGDSSKAKLVFRFNPKVRFKEIVKIMVESDVERIQRGDFFG